MGGNYDTAAALLNNIGGSVPTQQNGASQPSTQQTASSAPMTRVPTSTAPLRNSGTGVVMMNTHPNEPLNHMHAARAQSMANQAQLQAARQSKILAESGNSAVAQKGHQAANSISIVPPMATVASGIQSTAAGATTTAGGVPVATSSAASAATSGATASQSGSTKQPQSAFHAAPSAGRPCVVMAGGAKVYPCFVCGKLVDSEVGLDRHQRSNSMRHYAGLTGVPCAAFPVQCPRCKICLRSADQLAMHQKSGYCVSEPSQLLSPAASEVYLRRLLGAAAPSLTQPVPGTQSKITSMFQPVKANSTAVAPTAAAVATSSAAAFANKQVAASVSSATDAAAAAVATLAATASVLSNSYAPLKQPAAGHVVTGKVQSAVADYPVSALNAAVPVPPLPVAVSTNRRDTPAPPPPQSMDPPSPLVVGKHPLTPALSGQQRRSKRARFLVPRERQLYYNICSLLVQSSLPAPPPIKVESDGTAVENESVDGTDNPQMPHISGSNFENFITDETARTFLNTLKDVLNIDSS